MHRFAGIFRPSCCGMTNKFRCRRLTPCLLLTGLLFATSAQAGTELERKVKAAFIYNFAKFVDWPPQVSDTAGSEFVICVAGETALGTVINKSLANRPVKNRSIKVRNIGWATQKLGGCHMLYVNDLDTRAVNKMLGAAIDRPILTIGESSDFVQKGGIIQLMLIDEKIRFSVNQAIASKVGLTISAKLLEVALRVMRARPGDNGDRSIVAPQHVLLS